MRQQDFSGHRPLRSLKIQKRRMAAPYNLVEIPLMPYGLSRALREFGANWPSYIGISRRCGELTRISDDL
jgi:hypothetical protein